MFVSVGAGMPLIPNNGEASHGELNRVHDASPQLIYQIMYDQSGSFDARIMFMLTPVVLFFVIVWLAFDWMGCFSYYFQNQSSE